MVIAFLELFVKTGSSAQYPKTIFSPISLFLLRRGGGVLFSFFGVCFSIPRSICRFGASIITALHGVGRVRLNSRFWGDLRDIFFSIDQGGKSMIGGQPHIQHIRSPSSSSATYCYCIAGNKSPVRFALWFPPPLYHT